MSAQDVWGKGVEQSLRLRQEFVATHFEKALEEGQVEVWYQPIVRLQTDAVCGAEALVRWGNASYGMMDAASFVPTLEQAGTSHLLDAYVVDKVTDDCAALLKRGDRRLFPLSLNLSAASFESCDMAGLLSRALEDKGLSLDLIEVDVSGRASDKAVEDLRGLALHVWADGFGANDSPLSILADRPYDGLKFSCVFARNLSTKPRTRIVLGGAVDMAKRMGIQTLAKGVETADQRQFLHKIGCEKALGFLFGPAAPLDALLGRLDKGELASEPYESHGYYDVAGRVNILSIPTEIFGTNADNNPHQTPPLAVVEAEGDQLRYLSASDAHLSYLRGMGVSTLEEATACLNNPDLPMGADLLKAMQDARTTGKSAMFDSIVGGERHRAMVTYLATDRNRGAFSCMVFGASLLLFNQLGLESVRMGTSKTAPVLSKGALWDSVLDLESIGFFWKDVDRRFVGVSPSFLSYYGFASAEEIVGKTDEDMGWHVDPEPFAEAERAVILQGKATQPMQGTCIVHGEIRTIVARKVPIYENDKIVGLLGCFVDEGGYAEAAGEGAAGEGAPGEQAAAPAAEKDPPVSVGFLDNSGLGGWLSSYIRSYESRGIDFIACAIKLRNYDQLCQDHGDQFGTAAVQALTARIDRTLHSSGVYRITEPSVVMILKQFNRLGDADVFVESVRDIAKTIHEVEGVSVQLSLAVAPVRYGACGSREELEHRIRRTLQD